MKCTICDSTGIEKVYDKRTNAYFHIPCATCHGTGHINQTNEEWFCGLTTEEKAKVLRRKTYGNGDENKREEKGWENWLNAEHEDNPPDIPNAMSWDEWIKAEKMKCSICGGIKDFECEFYEKRECPYQSPTNEEWMKSLDTEELVTELKKMDKWIKRKMKKEIGSFNKFERGDYYREWLREEHNEV